MSVDLRIETATQKSWQTVVRWATQESWELGDGDAERFMEVDPAGFQLGVVGGVPVAAVSIVRVSEAYAHLGHYLVDRDHRGRGFGLETWRRCISEMPRDLPIGLDGMPSQVANYERWGFVTQYLTHRMRGELAGIAEMPAWERIPDSVAEDVIEFDARCVGYRREAMLRRWFTGYGRVGFVARERGEITGLIGARFSTTGLRIGPFHAADDLVARQLLSDVCSTLSSNTSTFIDVPEFATSELQFLQSLGFAPIFQTHRMYRGAAPDGRTDLVRAVASLELG